MKVEKIGDATLYLGDCMDILPTLDKVDAVVTDPPYEGQAHTAMRRTRATNEGRVKAAGLGFDAITDDARAFVASECARICGGWAGFFCQVEAVFLWKSCLESSGAKWDRAWAWIKPDSSPRFNGQGPAQGFECFATAWCGDGRRSWNGGGRRNVTTHNVTSGRKSDHPTEKPEPLICEFVGLYSCYGQIVLDPFMGSGTTGVACANLGRKFIGIEKEPKYFDIACQRIEAAYAQGRLFE